MNVAPGDFDNDGDLDLYLVVARAGGNRPNVLLENLGDGTFVEVADAGGARGPEAGHGGSVTTADVLVDWPSGSTQELVGVAADQVLVIEEAVDAQPRPPVVAVTSPAPGATVASPIVVEGTADDDRGVAQVRVAVKDTVTDRWWRGGGAWGAWLLHAAELTAPGAPTTGWRLTFPDTVAGRRYNVLVTGWDVDGELVERRAWTWVRAAP